MLVTAMVTAFAFQAPPSASPCIPEEPPPAFRVPVFSPAKLVVGDEEKVTLFRVASVALTADLSLAVTNRGTNEILVFEPDGAPRMTLGGSGGGPAEFASISSARLMEGDRLAVTDPAARKVVVFDLDSGFVASYPLRDLRVQSVFPLPDGQWLAFSTSEMAPTPEGGRFREEAALTLHAANGDLVRHVLSLPGAELWDYRDPQGGGMLGAPPFAKHAQVEVDRAGCVWVSTGEDSELRAYDVQGRSPGEISLPREKPVTQAEWDATIEAMVQRGDRASWPRMRQVLKQIPFDPVRPPLKDINFDDEGRVWITPYGPQGDIEGWWVFSWLGSEPIWVPAPSDTRRLLDIRYGHAVLLHVSDLGVETVTVHALSQKRHPAPHSSSTR